MGKRAQNLGRQRQYGLVPQRLVRLAIVGIGRIPRQTEQHGRHTKGEGNLARGSGLQSGKVHIGRRQGQCLPFQPAFEQQRPTRIVAAGKLRGQLFLQPVKLFTRQRLCTFMHQSTTGPRGIVE